MESEVHQVLGEIKIQEICERYFLGDGGKIIIDRILLRLKFSNLAEKNNKTVISVINQEADGCPGKAEIEKILLDDIFRLLTFEF